MFIAPNFNATDTYILGAPFIENFVTEFDYSKNVVRFSLHADYTTGA